uniref:Ig-like domain-containing protein n=1 Tax=Dromaius novaehollandiae TaxID=8790 RepID=A0A8C4IZN9_DRONO
MACSTVRCCCNAPVFGRLCKPGCSIFADTFLTKAAALTCRVSNLPSTEGLRVRWERADGAALETALGPRAPQSNGLYSVDGTASVCADEWEKGYGYVCTVTHPDLLEPAQARLQRQDGA